MLRPAIHLFSGCCLAAALTACPDSSTTGTGDGSISKDTTVDAGASDTTKVDSQPDVPVDTSECTNAADCTASVDQCQATDCVSGACVIVDAAAGTACNDGNPCTDGDSCDGSNTCGGVAVVCDDGNPCTQDSCHTGSGDCLTVPTPGVACDDGSACTDSDICSSAATCLGIPKICTGGGSGCMTGGCDDATGDCIIVPDVGESCDDGDVCTILDVCDDLGQCGGSQLPCDDDLDCTADTCDPASGACTYVVDLALCDDGDPCTDPTCDTLQGCLQVPTANCCSDDSGCYDGDDCTSDTCDPGTNLCSFPDNGSCCVSDTDCSGIGEVCVSGVCFPAGDPVADYGFPRPATWVSNLDLGGVEGAAECCFDLTGDGNLDNAVGDLVNSLSGLLGQSGINAALDEVIIDGTVNLIFAYPTATGANLPNIDPITVDAFQGDTVGFPSYTTKLGGNATFTVPADNFLAGTSLPIGTFGEGNVVASQLTAGPGKLYEVPLQVLYFDFSEASLEQANITGSMSSEPVGISVTGGKMGGVLPMVSVWSALNTFVETSCSCLNLTGPLVISTGEGSALCDPAPDTQVTCSNFDEENVCAQLNSLCNIALIIIQPDFDLDDNGVMDGMTVGIHFDGSGTEITGLTP